MSETVREAAQRNAEAIKAGNFMQIMADITPEAMAQMMQLSASASVTAAAAAAPAGFSMTNLPTITSYELTEPVSEMDGGETITATFTSALGSLTISSTWKQVTGKWKIASISNLQINPASPA